jgi:8-oxo-dGTP pyrophosphatase MutT (NUDIX family)
MVDEGRNPWIRRSRRSAYENAWIEVLHDEVVRPDGSDGVYGVVHFRSRALGVVVADAGRVLLVGQYRYPLERYSWEIPEGGVPLGEDPLVGAQRELREETGYRAARWTPLVEFSISNSATDETGGVFLAEDLTPGAASPEETEELATRWVELDVALHMIDRGEIHDIISQAGLLRYALRRV